jgi:large subunit ribosomal protein L30
MAGKLKVTQIKSAIGRGIKQQETCRALGLRKVGAVNIVPDNACSRGQINKVSHLVKVEEV